MNVVMIVGTIEGPINVKTVGESNLKLAEYKIDGMPVQSWGDSADKVPPIGTQVVASGSAKARSRQAQSGAVFTDISISISRFEQVGQGQTPALAPAPTPAAPKSDADAMFED